MSPFAQVTDVDQGGGVLDEDTCGHEGSPERLWKRYKYTVLSKCV